MKSQPEIPEVESVLYFLYAPQQIDLQRLSDNDLSKLIFI